MHNSMTKNTKAKLFLIMDVRTVYRENAKCMYKLFQIIKEFKRGLNKILMLKSFVSFTH